VAAVIDKPVIQQGDKTNLKLTVTRNWPELKNPIQVMALAVDLPQNLIINNNQPFSIAPDKNDASLVVDPRSNLVPGVYNLFLRTQVQIPYNKNPKDKQKQPVQVVLPSTPVTFTVLPKTVGALALNVPNPSLKVGTQIEIVVKVTRQFEYAGEFKVELVLPPNFQGLTADPVTIPADQNEVKIIVKAAANAPLGQRTDLVIR